MTGGYLNKCIECAKTDIKNNYRVNRRNPAWMEKERARGREKAKRLKYDTKLYRKNNPEKYKAHSKVSNAIRGGKLKRLPCRVCGADRTEAHHFDYSKPLDVYFYCVRHHRRIHKFLTYLEQKKQ